MAHVQKLKAQAVAPMLAHYDRVAERERGYRRENIDPDRMRLNYNLRPRDARAELARAVEQHAQAAGKALRKDANVAMDWVVTLPQDCPREKSREFFEAVTAFIEERYGERNVLGAFVHMDETTPHVHVPFLPRRDGKLQASYVVNRADLKSFHGDLGAAVDAALGFHVSIELDDGRHLDKALRRSETQEQFKAAKRAAVAEIERETAEAEQRLERLRREIAEKESEPAGESIAESVRTLAAGRGDGKRERDAAAENARLRSRIRGLERDCEAARSRIERLRGRIEGLRRQIAERLEGRARRTPLADRFARAKAHSAAAERVSRPRTHQRARSGLER